jgi:hypothetical protein
LQAGYSGLLGISAAAAAQSASAAPTGSGSRARSVVLVYLTGGCSHIDTFDPKPDQPLEVRGEFKTVATTVPGIQLSEHVPGFASRMKDWALIRSMTHKNNGHLPATHWMLTGKAIPGIPLDLGVDKIRSRSDWPSYTSAINYFRPPRDGVPNGINLPTYLIEGPLLWPGQFAGCLGPKFDPWQIRDDPNKKEFRVENLSLPAGFGVERLQARRSMLDAVNAQQDRLGRLAETEALSDDQKSAFSLLTSSRFGKAFQIDQEPESVRDRYGRHMFGQSLLLARRLVEAGVPVIQANMGIVQTWDNHGDIANTLQNRLLPPMDRGVGALLDDLKMRGLFDQTLVIVVGDFGRTPKLSNLPGDVGKPGRDHWCEVFSALFAGAGVRGGQVIGASDARGGSPATRAVTPDDLGATVYQALGIEPSSEFIDREGRRLALNTGQAIEELYQI